MQRIINSLLVSLCLLMVGPAPSLAEEGKQKVVYHINTDDPIHQAAALRNIQNHINAVGADKLDLKVVMHGKGLALLLYPDAKDKTLMKMANPVADAIAVNYGSKDLTKQV